MLRANRILPKSRFICAQMFQHCSNSSTENPGGSMDGMSDLTYHGVVERRRQTTRLAAWRGQDSSALAGRAAYGRIPVAACPARNLARHADFQAHACDRFALQRTSHSGCGAAPYVE